MKKVGLKIIGVLVIAIILLHSNVLLAANSAEESNLTNKKNESDTDK